MITVDDLDYELPGDRIAQTPVEPRDHSRVLVVDRRSKSFEECRFSELPHFMDRRDLLVVNDTRVVPAKLRGHKASGGKVEVLLLEEREPGVWIAFMKSGGRTSTELKLNFDGIGAEVIEVLDDGRVMLQFEDGAGDVRQKLGEMPLPPYIDRSHFDPKDTESYQTIFARQAGAVAAPTASLHFTTELAARLRIEKLTLHVGLGTFQPIRQQKLDDHRMDAERYEVPLQTVEAIQKTQAQGGQVIAVGTTVVRGLEASNLVSGVGRTDLFIQPGYHFEVVDELITNFHLPRSTLLALVMAFAGVELTRKAYSHAIKHGFRFYSYGDAMWIR